MCDSSPSLFVGFLSGGSIHCWKWVLSTIVLLFMTLFRSVSICFIYLGAPILGVCIFMVLYFLGELTPLTLYKWPFLSLATVFGLESILYDIKYNYSTFSFSLDDVSIFSHHFILSPCVFLKLKWAYCR